MTKRACLPLNMSEDLWEAIQICLSSYKLCVRLSPDGTYKPEGEVKMSEQEFIDWVLARAN